MDTQGLVKARKEAEKVVAEMPDGDLKLKAFEVILGKLLEDGNLGRKDPAAGGSKSRHEPRNIKNGLIAKSAPARILVLRNDGFFKNQRSIAEILEELARHGWHYPRTSLSGPLQKLTQQRELRRVKSTKNEKNGWLYSES